jgi:hypothetical protein
MKGPDGNYDEKKGSPFEILALQMQMYADNNDGKRLQVMKNLLLK